MVVRIESHPFIIECGSVAAPVIVCLDGGRLRAQAVGACWKVSIGESVIFLAGGDEVKVSSHARHYRHTKEQVESKYQMNASMVSDHIVETEKLNGLHRSEYEKALKYTSASSLITSADTTSSTLMAFTLAMVENPHTRKHAQEDIDAVRTDHTCHMLTQSYGRY
ncbi:hypothetical protein V8E55_007279 [Tylopilus felleus]